jgi:hypothetical protein
MACGRGRCVWKSRDGRRCPCTKYIKNTSSRSTNPNICHCGHGHVWHEIITEPEPEPEYNYQSISMDYWTTPTPTPAPTPAPTPTTRYSSEMSSEMVSKLSDVDTNLNLCIACDNQSKTVVIYPCRHLCMCETCFKKWRPKNNTCPICRGNIDKFDIVIV